MCRYLKQRANRFCGAYNYGVNIIRSAYLANMANGEWFRHVRELSRTGMTMVDKWKIIKCPDCGLAYVFDPSIKSCHHCLKRYKNRKPIDAIQNKCFHTRKQCAACGRIFIDESKTQRAKYCSPECRKEGKRMMDLRYREKKKGKMANAKISECTGNTRNQTDRKCG